MKTFVIILCTLMPVATALGAVYKWVDEGGGVHYSDSASGGHANQEVEIKPAPSPEEIAASRQSLERMEEALRSEENEYAERAELRSLENAGSLPPNTYTKYLQTVGTNVSIEWNDEITARFGITVRTHSPLPRGARYLEATFPNPDHPYAPYIVDKEVRASQDNVLFVSPPVKGLKCKNYDVVVKLCRTQGCQQKIPGVGEHHQLIQSRIDTTGQPSEDQLVKALTNNTRLCRS